MAEKKNKTASQPTIRVSGDSLRKIVQYQQGIEQTIALRNLYMSGLREGLNVPNDWVFDMKLGAFIPPTEGKRGT